MAEIAQEQDAGLAARFKSMITNSNTREAGAMIEEVRRCKRGDATACYKLGQYNYQHHEYKKAEEYFAAGCLQVDETQWASSSSRKKACHQMDLMSFKGQGSHKLDNAGAAVATMERLRRNCFTSDFGPSCELLDQFLQAVKGDASTVKQLNRALKNRTFALKALKGDSTARQQSGHKYPAAATLPEQYGAEEQKYKLAQHGAIGLAYMAGSALDHGCLTVEHKDSCNKAGVFTLNAKGNPDRALMHFRKGCGLGDATSCRLGGLLLFHGVGQQKREVHKSIAYFDAGCHLGDGNSCSMKDQAIDEAKHAKMLDNSI